MLVADDDEVFRRRLAASLQRRGYETHPAATAHEALELARDRPLDAGVIDLKMGEDNGLALIRELRERHPSMRLVVLTGYGSIATAVEAMRLGAIDYLTKPADTEQVEAALRGAREEPAESALEAPSLGKVEWEHLQRVLQDCGGNISQAARVLGLDRRSLQRKLQKYPPVR